MADTRYKMREFDHLPHIFPAASETEDGMMSAADKVKLDGLPVTTHYESDNISVSNVDNTAVATFSVPFLTAPPNPGGYKFQYSIARTDGVAGLPSVVISNGLTVNDITFTIIDNFQGVISWSAWV